MKTSRFHWSLCLLLIGMTLAAAGCRSTQKGRIKSIDEEDRIGSHAAGAGVYDPMVDQTVGRLLANEATSLEQAQAGVPSQYGQMPGPPGPKHIVFFGVENKGIEELGPFRDAMEEQIETQIVNSRLFRPVSKRYLDAGLRDAGLRADQLFNPANQQLFIEAMHRNDCPFDYFLFATVTSTETRDNYDSQRDYGLSLELVDSKNGYVVGKDRVELRKDYDRSMAAKFGSFFKH